MVVVLWLLRVLWVLGAGGAVGAGWVLGVEAGVLWVLEVGALVGEVLEELGGDTQNASPNALSDTYR